MADKKYIPDTLPRYEPINYLEQSRWEVKPNPKPGEHFDPEVRAKEKQASRDKDAADLASGRKTREQLRKENGFLSAIPQEQIHINYLAPPPADNTVWWQDEVDVWEGRPGERRKWIGRFSLDKIRQAIKDGKLKL